jgi:DNA mismatch repair protein MutS
MYDERGPEGDTKTNFPELVELLGLTVSVKKGEGPSGPLYDGLVAGIPEDHLHKWSARLTQLGWTVVVVDQVKNPAGKVVKREVSRILTPGSHIEAASSQDIYMTFVSLSLKDVPYLALTALDLSTGHLHTFECKATGSDDAWTSNEAVQFMELYEPREILWSIEGPKYFYDSMTESKLKSILGCPAKTVFHKRAPLNSGAWLKPGFKEEYLRSRCSLKSLLPTHVALSVQQGSKSEIALISLLYALEELWPSMNLGALHVFPWNPMDSLKLGENALVQLHMIVDGSSGKQDVLSIMDKCLTPMGHRGIRERLLKPSASAAVINQRLDAVHQWTQKPADYRVTIQKRMRTIADIDRLYRRIQQGTTTATDLMSLDNSLKALDYIAKAEQDLDVYKHVAQIQNEVFKIFDIKKIYEADEDTSLFVTGISPDLDLVEHQIKAETASLQQWIDERAKEARVAADSFKVEFKEKSLVVKGPRGIIQALKISNKLPAGTTAVLNKGSSYLESNDLDRIFFTITRLRYVLKVQQGLVLIEKGTVLTASLFSTWSAVTEWITYADVNLCLACVAMDLGYVRPEILDCAEGAVCIEGLRHPLLEAQDKKVPYVQHSVSLGDKETQGWLLYGLNASGKSSLMRATGLAVLLAQAGSFVPATKMSLSPFQSLHTRIINTDNLWMGLSSFAVEMSEMREIFKEAGPRSLVLGDELCSGTETTSATALVAAGIKGLLGRGAKFLFATHLHGLSQISEVSNDPKLQIKHLHVEYDRLKDKLVYHRTLKDGPGSSLYGLEVAKAMRIPSDILEDAIKFRKQLAGEAELSESIGSSWNPAVVRRKCQICGCTEAGDLEVHHIRERQTTTTGRLADGSSVHAQSNLAVICDSCHDEIHRGTLSVEPPIQTSDGPEESVSVFTSSASTNANLRAKSKWSAEEQTTIETVCRQYPKLSNANLSKHLLNYHQIEITAVSLKKFR